jgi:hypothetical protein
LWRAACHRPARRHRLLLSTAVGLLRAPHSAAVRLLREELQLLQEPGSYVGEVIKVRVQ